MLPAVIKFYREEQNMREFEKWQTEKQKQQLNKNLHTTTSHWFHRDIINQLKGFAVFPYNKNGKPRFL